MIFFKKYAPILLSVAIFALGFVYVFFYSIDDPRYDLILEQSTMLKDGIQNTLLISGITLVCSLFLGFLLFLALRSKNLFLRSLATLFREIILGTPLLVMIFLAVYVVGDLVSIQNKFFLGTTALILYMAPYMANSFATAISVVDVNQFMEMDLYGYTLYQRYRHIILPQMIAPLMPSLLNQLSSIVKGSALLKIVSVSEISYVITVISARNWAVIEGYYIMWLSYLVITIPLSLLAHWVEKKVEL